MITTQQALGLFAVAVVLTAVPGPSVLFVISRSVTLGRRAGLATVVGNEIGMLVQGSATAVGLGAVVARSIAVYTVIKLVGAGYLCYLGLQAIRGRHRLGAELAAPAVPATGARIVRQGAIVGLSNPKMFLVFAAILPQFVDRRAGDVPLQMFLLCLVCVAIALTTDSVWALVAGTARSWFTRSPRRLELVGGGAGVVMIGLGARLALTGRGD